VRNLRMTSWRFAGLATWPLAVSSYVMVPQRRDVERQLHTVALHPHGRVGFMACRLPRSAGQQPARQNATPSRERRRSSRKDA
jgi:hypothetical protein